MGIAEVVLLVLVGLTFLNVLLQAFFCRVMRHFEGHYIDWDLSNMPTTLEINKQNIQSNKSIKHIIRYFFDHYLYGLMRYSIIKVGKIPSNRIRRFVYRHVFCMNITNNTVINGGCEFRSPWNIYADRCTIMSGCILDGRSGIRIGQDVVFGVCVHIWTEEHDLNDPEFKVHPWNRGPVIIGDHAWICSDSTVLPRTRIGEGAVVAARACVTKECEPYCVYGGVPAKKISERNSNLTYQSGIKPHWHFY